MEDGYGTGRFDITSGTGTVRTDEDITKTNTRSFSRKELRDMDLNIARIKRETKEPGKLGKLIKMGLTVGVVFFIYQALKDGHLDGVVAAIRDNVGGNPVVAKVLDALPTPPVPGAKAGAEAKGGGPAGAGQVVAKFNNRLDSYAKQLEGITDGQGVPAPAAGKGAPAPTQMRDLSPAGDLFPLVVGYKFAVLPPGAKSKDDRIYCKVLEASGTVSAADPSTGTFKVVCVRASAPRENPEVYYFRRNGGA